MEVGRKESGAVSWIHEREAKLYCLFLTSFFEILFLTTLSFFAERRETVFGIFWHVFFFVFVRCFFFSWPCTSKKNLL